MRKKALIKLLKQIEGNPAVAFMSKDKRNTVTTIDEVTSWNGVGLIGRDKTCKELHVTIGRKHVIVLT